MNAYLAKKDLEKYSIADLTTLAKYYNVTTKDYDELCWLLSLHILEDKQTVRGTMNGAKVENLLRWARENGVESRIQGVLDGSTVLNLKGMNLNTLSKDIDALNLTSLNLEDNNLTELPVSIGNIKNLLLLFLQNNQLETIPDEIENLDKLFGLNLTGNPLKELPIGLVKLHNLHKINIDDDVFDEYMTDELSSLLEIIPAGNENWKQNRDNILRDIPNSRDKNVADSALIYYIKTGEVPKGEYPTHKTAR